MHPCLQGQRECDREETPAPCPVRPSLRPEVDFPSMELADFGAILPSWWHQALPEVSASLPFPRPWRCVCGSQGALAPRHRLAGSQGGVLAPAAARRGGRKPADPLGESSLARRGEAACTQPCLGATEHRTPNLPGWLCAPVSAHTPGAWAGLPAGPFRKGIYSLFLLLSKAHMNYEEKGLVVLGLL